MYICTNAKCYLAVQFSSARTWQKGPTTTDCAAEYSKMARFKAEAILVCFLASITAAFGQSKCACLHCLLTFFTVYMKVILYDVKAGVSALLYNFTFLQINSKMEAWPGNDFLSFKF